MDFWFEAMLYANQMLQRRPSFGNSEMASPDEDFYGVAPRNGHFREWGCVTYVHEDDPKGFNVKAKKGTVRSVEGR
jgi:hypothetical protein